MVVLVGMVHGMMSLEKLAICSARRSSILKLESSASLGLLWCTLCRKKGMREISRMRDITGRL